MMLLLNLPPVYGMLSNRMIMKQKLVKDEKQHFLFRMGTCCTSVILLFALPSRNMEHNRMVNKV